MTVRAAAKWLGVCGAAAFGGLVGFGYSDPSWTRRRFDEDKCPPPMHTRAPTRAQCVEALLSHNTPERALDVLVIGGGCVGTGVALDAATRGLTVGLVEMGDYASQTSSRSTKLIHGGIRYLQKAVFQLDKDQLLLVAEALRERSIMLHQAPHLCHGLPTLVPCYQPHEIPMYWLGTKLYDLIAALYGGTIGYSGFVSVREMRELYPALRDRNATQWRLRGAVRYYDGQMNDARLCYTIAATAAAYGAATVNYATVTRMETVANDDNNSNNNDNNSSDKDAATAPLIKATITDTIGNRTVDVYARSIVNAGGPFTTQIEQLAAQPVNKVTMVPAAGTHIVIDRRYAPREHEAMVVPSSDGRVVFTIPWLGGCLVGTTDHPCPLSTDPRPTRDDVDFLLQSLEPYVGTVPREAVKSAWAGIRPLAMPAKPSAAHGDDAASGRTENIVRDHFITVDTQNRIVSVTGGKWTTYRRMAQQATDTLLETLLHDRARAVRPCCTDELVLVGARALDTVPATPPLVLCDAADGTATMTSTLAIPDDVHRHWRSNYGDRYGELVALARQGGGALMRRLADGGPVVEAEVVWAARHEHCERVSDFLARRTRMMFVDAAMAEACVPRVAELMAQEKKWTRAQHDAELQRAYAALQSFRAS